MNRHTVHATTKG